MLLAILLLMLPDLISMLEICMLVYEIVMICILLLIWKLIRKLPNYSTIQKPCNRPFSELSVASFADALRSKKFSGAHFRRWQVKVTNWLTAMKVF